MLTKRRQLRKRHTRRRMSRRRTASRKQFGGGREDYDIIRLIHSEVNDPAIMIAMMYKTPELYNKCSDFPPASPLGGPRARDMSIPERFARPASGMKPLNSMLRCAYNFFNPYAGKYRGDEAEPVEWDMARQINRKLEEAFWTFMNADPETRPTGKKVEKANRLFNTIRRFIDAMSQPPAAEREAANRERLARARALEEAEKERARIAQKEMTTATAAANRFERERAKSKAKNYWSNWEVATRERLNQMRREGHVLPPEEAAGGAGAAGVGMLDPDFM